MHKLNLMRPSYSSNTLSLNTTFLPFSHDYKMTSASPEVEKLNRSSPYTHPIKHEQRQDLTQPHLLEVFLNLMADLVLNAHHPLPMVSALQSGNQ